MWISETNWPFWGWRNFLPVLNCLVLFSMSIGLVCRLRKLLSFFSPLLGAFIIAFYDDLSCLSLTYRAHPCFLFISDIFHVPGHPSLFLAIHYLAILFSEVFWQSQGQNINFFFFFVNIVLFFRLASYENDTYAKAHRELISWFLLILTGKSQSLFNILF